MSGNSLDRLIYMVNQIAREFTLQHPDRAAEATFDHLWHFWDPRMRRMISAHLVAGGEGLSDAAREAVDCLEQRSGEPRSVTQATRFNSAAEGPDRNLMSDAG